MRKFLISAAVLASTFAVATPAAAQWAPPQPQGYAYGYNNNYGQVRRLDQRVQQIRVQIRQLDHRRILSNREARRLENEASSLQRRIRAVGRNGLNQREYYDVERRLANLERRVYREANDGNRYRGQYPGQDGRFYDRDRDGRDDRYEDDRGYRHD
jgi:hypothetical protein